MQSYKDVMRDLAIDAEVHEEMLAKISSIPGDQPEVESFDLTPDHVYELTRQGVTVIPKSATVGLTMLNTKNPALMIAAAKRALIEQGKAEPVKRNKVLTREDFPSRQAWRNHLRQKAKGY